MVQMLAYPPELVAATRFVSTALDLPITDVVRSGEALFLETSAAVNALYPDLPGGLSPEAIAVIPLSVRGRMLGAMALSFDEPRVFDEDDRTFILALGRQCAQALDRARLYEAAARARVAAEAANRAKDEFLSILSHELRTPLTAILGWADILRTRRPEPPALERALRIIERNAKALVQLIEDILDVSRIVAGKLRLDLRAVDPAAAVRAAIDVVRPLADAKGIVIEAALEDAGTLAADPQRLQQIVWNLLSNAVKFSPQASRIEVRLTRVSRDGGGVELRVIDSGSGIEPDFLPHVFERFRQADGSSTRSSGGLGLGLAIVKHLVELHEGTITAESGGAGRGSTFTVTLPFRPRIAGRLGTAWVADPATPWRQRLDGVRVVIVDDEPDARDLIATILRDQGAHVTVAASALEAVAAVKLERPDVFVSDIGMPDEDGYALLEKVRALTADPHPLPALALTAYAGVEDARMAVLAGFQRHLAKPVAPAQLIDAVARLAGRAAPH
jgi:signal transduction histidine kinase/CheY-like chemotaxis protein